MMKPFSPSAKASFYIANGVASSAAILIPYEAEQVVLYNSSATAISFVRLSALDLPSDLAGAPAAVAAGLIAAPGDFPIPPGQLVRVTLPRGRYGSAITVIASAADGNTYVTPGHGL
jgi:hypothetical protein